MRVENLGLPGSGKSTLMQAVHKRLVEGGVISVSPSALDTLDKQQKRQGMQNLWSSARKRQSYRIAQFAVAHPKTLARLQGYFADRMRNHALALSVGSDVMKYDDLQGKLGVFWADEGFLHTGIYGILQSDIADKEQELEALINDMPQPGAVLYLRNTPQQSMEGLRKRLTAANQPQERIDRKTDETSDKFKVLVQRAKLIEHAVTLLRARKVKVIEHQAYSNLDQMVAETLQELSLEN